MLVVKVEGCACGEERGYSVVTDGSACEEGGRLSLW